MRHIANGIGHIDSADDGHEQGKAEGEHVHVATKEQNQESGEQQNCNTGHATLHTILGEEGRYHGSEDRNDNIYRPGHTDARKNGAIHRNGTKAERGHRRNQLHGNLRHQSHQEAQNSQYCQAQTHGERSLRHSGQIIGSSDEDDGLKNARIVDSAHQRADKNKRSQSKMATVNGCLDH